MTRAAVRSHFAADSTNSPPCTISRNSLSKPLAHGDEDAIIYGITYTDVQPAAPEYRSGPSKMLDLPAQTGAWPGHIRVLSKNYLTIRPPIQATCFWVRTRARGRPGRGPCGGAWKKSAARQGFACDGENRVCSYVSDCWAETSASSGNVPALRNEWPSLYLNEL